MKVFCLGFNKTGTSSLHQFFLAAGLRSVHDDRWPAWTWIPEGKQILQRFDAYSDGEHCNFKMLKQWFPDSAFVLNTRPHRDWLRSRVKHVLRLGNMSKREALQHPGLGKMACEFFVKPELAIRKWLLEKVIFEDIVEQFFSGDPAFIKIDVTAEADWVSRLVVHLNQLGFQIASSISEQQFHANPRDHTTVADQELLKRMFAFVDSLDCD